MNATHKIKSSTEALAEHLGWDISDVKDCIYQPSRGVPNVYSVGEEYFCAVPENRKPPKYGQNRTSEWVWEEIPSYVNQFGYKIFVQREEIEN